MSSKPTHRLYFASKNKDGARTYHDLCALWLDREKPYAQINQEYKDRPGIAKILLTNGKSFSVEGFYLNVKVADDAPRSGGGSRLPAEDFGGDDGFPPDDFARNHDDIPY